MYELFSGILGGSLSGALITWLLNLKDNRRKAHVSEITTQRIKWAEEIKGEIADFISFIECYRHLKDNITAIREIRNQMALLELNLNPLKDEFDEEYVNRMNELYNALVKGEDIETRFKEFKDLSKRMVKIEWDGIKLESEKGNPSKQDKLKLRRKWLV